MLDDVLAIPDHLRDALWRVESARLEPADAAGLLVCGMGGSAIGGDLAAAALGERLTRPLRDRARLQPARPGRRPTGRCSARATRARPRRRSPASRRPRRSARARIVASTGGALVDRARDAGRPGRRPARDPAAAGRGRLHVRRRGRGRRRWPGPPRASLPRSRTPPPCSSARADGAQARAAEIAERLAGTVPVIYGGELTAPVARRWKTQVNENAKLPAFFSELPEADHNEICGWDGRARAARGSRRHARGRRPAPAPAPPLRADRRGDRRRRHRGRAGRDRGRDADGAAASGR